LTAVPPADTAADATKAQLEIHRRMGPEARLRVGLELTRMARQLLVDGIRARHPEYDDEQVKLAAFRLWLGPALFRAAYPAAPELDP
jgi:hypothetical protein